MKLKPILPSLREKKRYIAFRVESDDAVTLKEARTAIEQSLQNFIGSYGIAQAGPQFLKDWKEQTGILRVNTKYVKHAQASFALIKTINNQKAVVSSMAVSGAISKIRSSYF